MKNRNRIGIAVFMAILSAGIANTETVNDRFVAEGIEVPFNQLDVHIANPKD